MRTVLALGLGAVLGFSLLHCSSSSSDTSDDSDASSSKKDAGKDSGKDSGKKDSGGTSTGDDTSVGDDTTVGDDDSGSLDAGANPDATDTDAADTDATTGDAIAPPPGDSGPAPTGCGTRTGQRGKTSRTVTVGSAQRTYVAYLPQSLDPTKPVPFVMVFHGFTMSGQAMYDITQYNTIADSDGVAVVYPDGQSGSPWNVSDNGQGICGAGAAVNNTNAVDFAFIDAIKADILQDQCLDTAHEFATGFSMGGYFSHHIGCDRTDFKAVGPASGGTIADLSSCKTGHVPVIIFHGTSDGLIAPGCDDPNSAAQAGFPPSATLWAKKNGCANTYKTTTNTGTTGAGQCYLYDGCPADGQVELCTFTGMSHAWAGGGGGGAFAAPTYASATQLEWAFWKKYAW